MLFTEAYLINQIQAIKCAYAKYSLKYADALAYNLCGLDCMYDKIYTVGNYIKIFERYLEEGIVCSGVPPCQLEDNVFTSTQICVYEGEGSDVKTCFSPMNPPFEFETVLTWIFSDTELTVVGGEETNVYDYTYYPEDSIFTFDSGAGIIEVEVVFSSDCSGATFTIGLTEYTVIIRESENTEYDCEWNSDCLTEEEIQDMITHSYKLLEINCGC